jgi:hypothetical protein
MRSESLRIIVLGHIIRGPVGGMAWHHLQYVLGLTRLGHDVWFFEDSQDYPACYDPSRGVTDTNPSHGLEFARHAFELIGAPSRWAYYDAHDSSWTGPAGENALAICESADLLLNMSGKNPLRPWFLNVPSRAFIDTDPVFTQIRHLEDSEARRQASLHTAFFTFGENLPTGCSATPPDGFPWLATRQPIVLDQWPVLPGPVNGRLTTVMLWDSYRGKSYDGLEYGMKSKSFDLILDLPRRVGPVFDLAVGSPHTPKSDLRERGWVVMNPLEVTRTPESYRTFLQSSKAEFSVAKHGYVVSRSGWFSERSAAYLASGRPVITQDTGYSIWLHADSGVLPFHDLESSIQAIEDLESNYDLHCEAARDVAATYFDSDKVLQRLLEQAMNPEPDKSIR